MATFTVEHESHLSKQETFSKVQQFLKNSDSLKSLDGNLKYEVDEESCSARVKGSKFECDVKITGENPSKVMITVQLSFLLSAFKGKIQETIQKKMGQLLG